ncbi:MAG: hypothetical protein FOGNACKC_05514 [Anaerolineae bacterium]|nr:hypothetical protein [Anaerolineae bacterium]
MRRPQNLDDYSQCVRDVNGILYVFCVECDRWRRIAVQATQPETIILVSQSGERWNVNPPSLLQPAYVCACCLADVGYLLTDLSRLTVANRAGINLEQPQ